MPPTVDSTVTAASHLAVANLGEEAVLLDSASGHYFGLNEVASRILELAKESMTVSAIVDRLLDEYNVEREVLEVDVMAFVRELEANGLVVVE